MWVEVKERVRRVGPHEFEPAGWQSSLCGFVREQAGAWLTRGEDKDDMRERSPRLVRAILRRLQHATVRSGWAVTMWLAPGEKAPHHLAGPLCVRAGTGGFNGLLCAACALVGASICSWPRRARAPPASWSIWCGPVARSTSTCGSHHLSEPSF